MLTLLPTFSDFCARSVCGSLCHCAENVNANHRFSQFPDLEPILKNRENAFAPWIMLPATTEYNGRETNARA